MNVNGVEGRLFTSKKNGNRIFLPAAGGGGLSYLNHAGSYGFCWSSTIYSGVDKADYLYFHNSNVYTNYYDSYRGRSVRPVSD